MAVIAPGSHGNPGAVLDAIRVHNQVSAALAKSADEHLWRRVLRVAPDTFAVPSTSRPELEHLVSVRRRRSPSEPAWACYACSCEARRRAACVHRAAVYQ